MGNETTAPEQAETNRAFVVIRQGERTWVTDLTRDAVVTLGRDTGANIRLFTPEVAPIHAKLHWDGRRVLLTDDAGPTFLNGKPISSDVELRAGDELSIGPCQLVVGVSFAKSQSGRRALTHQEFRERLCEVLARSARAGRPTSLVMIQSGNGDGRELTQKLLGQFRTGDLIGAYANDEIEVLLPDTTGDVARFVVARVLQQTGVPAIFGLAVAPNDAENHERLLRSARTALDFARDEKLEFSTVPERQRKKSAVLPTTRDKATRALMDRISEVADEDRPCLILGELSSGKGVFARMLHDRSPRATGPFIVVSCAMVQDENAARQHFDLEVGRSLRARGGTLFLDEISDLPLFAQERLHAMLVRYPEIRAVAGTQRTLPGLVERGAFDEALCTLLNHHALEVPSLRNRPEDILPMAEKFAIEAGSRAPVKMSPGAIARLRSYPWPGNVLELQNAMDRAVRLAGSGEILAEHLPSETLPGPASDGGLREHVDSVERDAILKALADSNHNQTHAAKRLGVSRRALIYKMEKYGLKRPPRGSRKTTAKAPAKTKASEPQAATDVRPAQA